MPLLVNPFKYSLNSLNHLIISVYYTKIIITELLHYFSTFPKKLLQFSIVFYCFFFGELYRKPCDMFLLIGDWLGIAQFRAINLFAASNKFKSPLLTNTTFIIRWLWSQIFSAFSPKHCMSVIWLGTMASSLAKPPQASLLNSRRHILPSHKTIHFNLNITIIRSFVLILILVESVSFHIFSLYYMVRCTNTHTPLLHTYSGPLCDTTNVSATKMNWIPKQFALLRADLKSSDLSPNTDKQHLD